MKRRGLTRILLIFLVLAALMVVYRMIAGPPAPDGFVVFSDLDSHELKHAVFELGETVEVAIRATGSLDPEAMPVGLAAQGWVVQRADREVVWRMDPQTVERGRGTIAHVRGDTFALDAGIYDVYYATYGQSGSRRRERWRSDADKWQFVLRLTDETASARRLHDQHLEHIYDSEDNLIWKTAPMRNGQEKAHLFEIKQKTEVEIYAVGEIGDEPKDFAWIEDAGTGDIVWGMTKDNTDLAGGLASNRQFRGTLTLRPGAYRVVSKTDRRHAYRNWYGNPPYDPSAWGLALYATDAEAIADFDPWRSRDPIVSFTQVPDNTEHDQRFEVRQPIQVVVYAVGEMTDRNSIYDYGELLKEEANRKRSVWKMSWDETVGAGGGKKNRLEVAFLSLEPGVYTFHYETDGSHAFDDWNEGAPDYPERWGATLFPMAVALDSGVVQLLEAPEEQIWTSSNAPLALDVAHAGEAIVSWTQLRGEVDERRVFELDHEAKLHIQAVGEITYSSQYDYGWIEETRTGDIVWEMLLDNTQPAGGADRNRRFDGVVTLQPGQYVIRFITDASHHYGFFGDEAPDDDDAWGITIHYVAEDDPVAEGETAAAEQ